MDPPLAAQEAVRRAEVLQSVLQQFWLPRRRLFRTVEGRPLGWTGPWHHWWQSHALAALVDRWDRTGDPAVHRQAERLVRGMRRRGRGRLTNEFYDDVGWLTLALFRLPGHDDDVRALLRTIRGGEQAEGGIAWSRPTPEFRNVPATGPAAIAALRFGARTGNDGLIVWGLSLVRWMQDTLVTADGRVPDGFRMHPDGTTSIDAARYTYNAGLVIGAELAALDVTADPAHLVTARRVADAVPHQFADPVTGVWRSEGPGDGALFRGILARYLAELALCTGDAALADSLQVQADAVWRASRGGPVGPCWPTNPAAQVPARRPGPPSIPDAAAPPVELSAHVGGLLVLEAAARVATSRCGS